MRGRAGYNFSGFMWACPQPPRPTTLQSLHQFLLSLKSSTPTLFLDLRPLHHHHHPPSLFSNPVITHTCLTPFFFFAEPPPSPPSFFFFEIPHQFFHFKLSLFKLKSDEQEEIKKINNLLLFQDMKVFADCDVLEIF